MSLFISKSRSWEMFNRIASKYDFINRVLSLGIDRYWRKKLLSLIPTKGDIGYLDLATGTGDVLHTVLKHRPNVVSGIGVDLSEGMLEKARHKLLKGNFHSNRCTLKLGDACDIPLKESSMDVVSIAFGIRNVPDVNKCLSEIYRVLRPEAMCLILEFSLPPNRLVRKGYLLYLRHVLPKIGGFLSGDKEAYSYLNETIESFPHGDDFKSLMVDADFKSDYQVLSFGLATLYRGYKIQTK